MIRDLEVIGTLKSSAEEIRSLRRRLEISKARLSGFDDALQLLNSRVAERHGMGSGVCAAFQNDRLADDLVKQRELENKVAIRSSEDWDPTGDDVPGVPKNK